MKKITFLILFTVCALSALTSQSTADIKPPYLNKRYEFDLFDKLQWNPIEDAFVTYASVRVDAIGITLNSDTSKLKVPILRLEVDGSSVALDCKYDEIDEVTGHFSYDCNFIYPNPAKGGVERLCMVQIDSTVNTLIIFYNLNPERGAFDNRYEFRNTKK